MTDASLSDKALSILTFAAYHSLTSGEQVKEVVVDDGKGHQADGEGLQALTTAGLIETGADDRARFTDAGAAALETLLKTIRGVAWDGSGAA